ncbi:hypothetical protein CHS0354_000916 [Potamilus streckersoni]|uniref:Uncharacterized protein n=1 Tax=Potamilus streckersoni TaxID=2493646 RepID=A0AAE0T5X7_9BIVA|nr:hypothetical protein CHS0354_000916 [Potamilus streckersoni]
MKTAVIVASLSVLAVCVFGQNRTCWTNFRCHNGFSCGSDQDPACIDHHCTCLTTHTCTHTSECNDISACQGNLRHHEVCYAGKCHCADITDVVGGVVG